MLNFFIFRLFLFKEKMTNRETCYSLVPNNYPVSISKVSLFVTEGRRV
jgi:hypothetical protein